MWQINEAENVAPVFKRPQIKNLQNSKVPGF